MTENLKRWNELKPVAADAQKDYKRGGGFGGTSVCAQWRLQRMTEVFGPVGKGWGYEIVERWSESGCAYVRLNAWYLESGEKCWTGEQIGGTEMSRTPDEAYKMSVTDALGKCFSQIGLASDVYRGQHKGDLVERVAADQQAEIQELIIETSANVEIFYRLFGISSLSELTATEGARAIKMLNSKKKGKSE